MKVVLRALRYFAQDKLLLLVWISIIVVQMVISLLQVWPTAVLVDAVLTHNPQSGFMHRMFLYFLPSGMLAQVIGITLIGMFLKMSQDGLGWLRRLINRRLELNGMYRARVDLYHKLQELGPAYQRMQPSGDSIYRVSTDVDGFRTVLNVLCDVFFAVFVLFVMASIMFSRNVPLTFVAMSIAPILMVANWYFAPLVKSRTLNAKIADTGFTTALIRSINGIFLVQSYGREDEELRRFKETAKLSADEWQKLNRSQASYDFIVQTTYSLAGAIIFGYGGYMVYMDQFVNHVQNGFTLGDIMVFMAYLGGLWDPMSKLTGAEVNLKPGLAGAERVFQVMDLKPATTDGALGIDPEHRRVSLSNVRFAYPEGREILHGVSVDIEPGQFVAFVGASGTGKSTLMNLLPRFYDPTGGSITMDGMDLRDIELADIRRHYATASQDSAVLAGTVRENISYGRPDAGLEQIQEAARRAGAHEFIMEMENGYDSIIAESGQSLSGGQRQRIALARALLSPAPVLLLDEPTSALDPEHEVHAMQSIYAERGARTVVMVTHRLASVQHCDCIYVMDEGVIVQQGTHGELLTQPGRYREMWKAQQSQD